MILWYKFWKQTYRKDQSISSESTIRMWDVKQQGNLGDGYREIVLSLQLFSKPDLF